MEKRKIPPPPPPRQFVQNSYVQEKVEKMENVKTEQQVVKNPKVKWGILFCIFGILLSFTAGIAFTVLMFI